MNELCSCGLQAKHPGVCKVKRRRNTLKRRIAGLLVSASKCPHGTHARYVGGKCRCEPCKEANRNYERERAKRLAMGITNKVISAVKARRHILKLSDAGIGYKTLADAAGVGKTIVQEVRLGQRKNIREETERRILSVDETAHASTYSVPAGPTLQRIGELLEMGYAKCYLARELGGKTPKLQIGRGRNNTVEAQTELKVLRLYNRLGNQKPVFSDKHFVAAAPAKALLRELMNDGWMLKQLREWAAPLKLHLNPKGTQMRASTAAAIEELYRKIREGYLRRAS